MTDYKQIRESLAFTELSPEEKKARGILGRLYGPCASIIAPTRNGRKYTDEVWKQVFEKNDVVKEMFANGGIPMELDHPTDREETCSEKIAAMLPEPPKYAKDGKTLVCYVDLIDSPCGRIAYQLAKYGFKLGISSRGSGDLYTDENGDESVDPNTYDFTAFDLVLLPAVKEARLEMCEALDTKTLKLKKALRESYDNATEEGRKIMKETLDDLDIDIGLEEAKNSKIPDIKDIPLYDLDESVEETVSDIELLDEARKKDASDDSIDDAERSEKTKAKEKEIDDPDQDLEFEYEEEDAIAAPNEETENTESDEGSDVAETEYDNTFDVKNVKDLIDSFKNIIKTLKNYDNDTEVTFKTIPSEDTESSAFTVEEEDDGSLSVNLVGYFVGDAVSNDNNIDTTEKIADLATVESSADNIEINDEASAAISSEVAEDNGIEEALNSLKEAVRQKDSLEQELKQLKSEKAVGDAKVKKLTEDLTKYKSSFTRMCEVASTVKDYKAKVTALNEEVSKSKKALQDLNEGKAQTVAKNTTLNENLIKAVDKTKVLEKELQAAQDLANQRTKTLQEQAVRYKQIVEKKTALAEDYKAKYEEVIASYIASKASMLGVNAKEITSKLNESYSLADIDNVCDQILDYPRTVNNLHLGISGNSKVKFTESKQNKSSTDPIEGYEIDEDLLRLAGLL